MQFVKTILDNEAARLNNRLEKIKQLEHKSPAIEFIELQQELKVKLQDKNLDRLSPEFQSWVASAAKKEKTLKRKMKTLSSDSQKRWDERFLIESQLREIESAVWRLNLREVA